MQSKLLHSLLLGVIASFGLTAQAGVNFPDNSGYPIFIRGDFNGWPGSGGAPATDDGVAPDAAADNKVWTGTGTMATTGTSEWKWAKDDWSQSSAENRMIETTTPNQVVTFYVDNVQKNDGFSPDANGGTGTIDWSDAPVGSAGETLFVTGSYQSELGFGGDYSAENANTALHDDGLNGDTTAADGIYTLSLTGLPAGPYQYLILLSGHGFNPKYCSKGWASGGGSDLTFNVIASSDTIKIEFNKLKARVRVTNNNPLLNPGPPFFALNSSWSNTLGPDTQLYDDGTHGDVANNDGVYTRRFEVTTATAGLSGVKVVQYLGPGYPGSTLGTDQGYPFQATAGQFVLVSFDTNTYGDGAVPSTRFVWTDPASRFSSNQVKAVGDWETLYGLSSYQNDGLVALSSLGSDYWGGNFGPLTVAPGPTTTYQWKAAGQPIDSTSNLPDSGGDPWYLQYGGPNDGYTRKGNNGTQNFPFFLTSTSDVPNFVVDGITGRTNVAKNVAPANPTRPSAALLNASAGPPASVANWSVY